MLSKSGVSTLKTNRYLYTARLYKRESNEMNMLINHPIVWLLDDNPLAAAYYQLCLKSTFFKVMAFKTLREFIKAFHPEQLGCILSEIQLRDGNGFHLLQKLKGNSTSTQVIFISQHADVRVAVQLMKQGAFSVLEKICPKKELITTLREAITLNQHCVTSQSISDDAIRRTGRTSK